MPARPDPADGSALAARRDRALATAIVVVGVGIGAAVVLCQTDSVTGLLDLRIYLGGARASAAGGSLYDHRSPVFDLSVTYPPLWIELVRPLAALPNAGAELVWTAVGLALWGRTLWVLAGGRRRPAGVTRAGVAGVWFVSLLSAPVWNTLNQGQVNLLVWALLVTDLHRISARGRGGWRIGLAAALKLTPALVVVLLAAARRTRAAATAVAAFVAATAVAWVLASGDSRRYWTELVFDTERVGAIGDAQNNSVAASVARAVGDGGNGPSARAAVAVLSIVVAIVVVGLAASRFTRALASGAVVTAAVLAGCAMALVSPISWTHHLVFLCFPLLLVLGGRDRGARLVAAAGAVALVDPVGWGRLAATSTLRTVAMVGLLVGADRLRRAELAWRESAVPVAGPEQRRRGSSRVVLKARTRRPAAATPARR